MLQQFTHRCIIIIIIHDYIATTQSSYSYNCMYAYIHAAMLDVLIAIYK